MAEGSSVRLAGRRDGEAPASTLDADARSRRCRTRLCRCCHGSRGRAGRAALHDRRAGRTLFRLRTCGSTARSRASARIRPIRTGPAPGAIVWARWPIELFAESIAPLRERDLDLLAKHWSSLRSAVQPGGAASLPHLMPDDAGEHLAGAFDVQYADAQAPRERVSAGERFSVARDACTIAAGARGRAPPPNRSCSATTGSTQMAGWRSSMDAGRRFAGRIEAGDTRRAR